MTLAGLVIWINRSILKKIIYIFEIDESKIMK
jgi:hypothetical protein